MWQQQQQQQCSHHCNCTPGHHFAPPLPHLAPALMHTPLLLDLWCDDNGHCSTSPLPCSCLACNMTMMLMLQLSLALPCSHSRLHPAPALALLHPHLACSVMKTTMWSLLWSSPWLCTWLLLCPTLTLPHSHSCLHPTPALTLPCPHLACGVMTMTTWSSSWSSPWLCTWPLLCPTLALPHSCSCLHPAPALTHPAMQWWWQ